MAVNVVGSNNTHLGRHFKCSIFCPPSPPILTTFRQIFIQAPNVKLYSNPYSGSRADIWGQTEGQKDMTKTKHAFRNFGKAGNNCTLPTI